MKDKYIGRLIALPRREYREHTPISDLGMVVARGENAGWYKLYWFACYDENEVLGETVDDVEHVEKFLVLEGEDLRKS